METIILNNINDVLKNIKERNYDQNFASIMGMLYMFDETTEDLKFIFNEELDQYSYFFYFLDIKTLKLSEENFKKIIDDLISISSTRKLDKIDVNYILFQEKVLKFIDKYKNKKITEQILKEQLYKLFEINDFQFLINQLKIRFNISI